ncbi:MAG: DUF72 domain-containing protein [Phycisphaera sp.]|nr:DUF72 domain-containing protein [Phycisphaera sp.]
MPKPPAHDTASLFGPSPEEPGRDDAEKGASARSAATKRGVGACAASNEQMSLAASLPAALRLGTSSWSFPGWRGLVYDRDASESVLARSGLGAYAAHPLFRTVGLDKTYYRPAPREEFARLAAQTPAEFSFLVKMWRGVLEPDGDPRSGAAQPFLDAVVATEECIAPAVEGLGEKAGPLLFQFSPLSFGGKRSERAFLADLRRFLAALPSGPLYAVEVRNRSLVGAELGELLADCGAVPCLTVHPTMPELARQSRELALDPTRPLVMRWMLRANHAYAEAKELYAPFDRIVEPDETSCDALAMLAQGAIRAGLGVWVVVNNKAEGSSPLSVERLARRIASRFEG